MIFSSRLFIELHSSLPVSLTTSKMLRNSVLVAFVCVVLSIYCPQVESKKFMRCELSRELLQKYQISKTFLSSWICLVEHESFLDTKVVKEKANGSKNHGLFQINSKNWCRMDRPGGYCNKKCQDFTDDNIDDDVECAKKIFDREGFKHWQGWTTSCRDPQNLPNLVVACNIHTLSAYRSSVYYAQNYHRRNSNFRSMSSPSWSQLMSWKQRLGRR